MVQLINDYGFNDPNKWSLIKSDWEDTEPSFNNWEAIMSAGWLMTYVKDEINWDYGDAGAYQGRIPHGNGQYFKSPLVQEPIINVLSPIPAGKLVGTIKVRLRSSDYPKKVGGYGRLDRACMGYAVAGLDFMLFLKLNTANKGWLNYDNPDWWGDADLATVEMFNRWYYDGLGWHQADNTHPCYNWTKQGTTHDNDYHCLRAGWILSDKISWHTFTVDFGEIINHLVEKIYLSYAVKILQVQIMGVGITTECYLGETGYIVEYASLEYNP
jgi:hypothetical protein